MKTKIVQIRKSESWSFDEHGDWYICPFCVECEVAEGSNYCPNCGSQINWIEEAENEI